MITTRRNKRSRRLKWSSAAIGFTSTPQIGGWRPKPPLVGWISAGVFAITRSWEIAWRLPSFLAAIALLVLLLRSAQVYGRVAALTAACALSFNLFVPRLASLVRTDMPLALVLFAIGLLIWEKIRTRAAWTRRDRLLLFLLLSAGMLIKGPIVYAFLLPGLVAFAMEMAWDECRGFRVVGMVAMAGLLSRFRCLGGRRHFSSCRSLPSTSSCGSSRGGSATRCIGRSRSIFICRISCIASRPGACC